MQILKFLEDLWQWITDKFHQVDPILTKIGTISVNITEAVKKFVESDTAAVITDLIPGDIDNSIRDLLIAIIPDVLSTSALLKDSEEMTADETITAWLKQAAKLDHDTRSSEYLSMSAKIVKELSTALADGKLTITEATGLVFSIYNGFIKNK